MPRHSSAMFGWSWTEVSVLGSQVFGQALMEGCEYPAVNTGELAGVGSVAMAAGVSHMQQVTCET